LPERRPDHLVNILLLIATLRLSWVNWATILIIWIAVVRRVSVVLCNYTLRHVIVAVCRFNSRSWQWLSFLSIPVSRFYLFPRIIFPDTVSPV